jgi:hypothetical protein
MSNKNYDFGLYIDEAFVVQTPSKGRGVFLVCGILFDTELNLNEHKEEPWWGIHHAKKRKKSIIDGIQRVGFDDMLLGLDVAKSTQVVAVEALTNQKEIALKTATLALILKLIDQFSMNATNRIMVVAERRNVRTYGQMQSQIDGLLSAASSNSSSPWPKWGSQDLEASDEEKEGYKNINGELVPCEWLVGQSMADHVLWNLRNSIETGPESTWQEKVQGRLSVLDLDSKVTFSEIPQLEDTQTMRAFWAFELGNIDAIDWTALLRMRFPGRWDGFEKSIKRITDLNATAAISKFYKQLGPVLENPGEMRAQGLRPDDVYACCRLLHTVIDKGTGLPVDIRAQHLHYMFRIETHAGRTAEAWKLWNQLQTIQPARKWTSPRDALQWLETSIGAIVVATDLRRQEIGEEIYEEVKQCLDEFFTNFEQLEPRGAALSALAQMYILLGAPAKAWPLLDEGHRQFAIPINPSYYWVWSLVAIGRGALAEVATVEKTEILRLIDMALNDIDGSTTDEKISGLSTTAPYTLWGIAEALSGLKLRGSLEAALIPYATAVIDEIKEWSRRYYKEANGLSRLAHPEWVAFRAGAALSDEEAEFLACVDSVQTSDDQFVKDLSEGNIRARIVIRTLVYWARTTGFSRELENRWNAIEKCCSSALSRRMSVGMDGVKQYIQTFLECDPKDPDNLDAFLELGGY